MDAMQQITINAQTPEQAALLRQIAEKLQKGETIKIDSSLDSAIRDVFEKIGEKCAEPAANAKKNMTNFGNDSIAIPKAITRKIADSFDTSLRKSLWNSKYALTATVGFMLKNSIASTVIGGIAGGLIAAVSCMFGYNLDPGTSIAYGAMAGGSGTALVTAAYALTKPNLNESLGHRSGLYDTGGQYGPSGLNAGSLLMEPSSVRRRYPPPSAYTPHGIN
jgi:hypothetical protein